MGVAAGNDNGISSWFERTDLAHIVAGYARLVTAQCKATVHAVRAKGAVIPVVTRPPRCHPSGQRQTEAATSSPTTPAPRPSRRPAYPPLSSR